MDIIKIKRSLLYKKIAALTSEEKIQIENIIDIILKNGNLKGADFINIISKILYFIDMSFIKMMAPQFKDEILTY